MEHEETVLRLLIQRARERRGKQRPTHDKQDSKGQVSGERNQGNTRAAVNRDTDGDADARVNTVSTLEHADGESMAGLFMDISRLPAPQQAQATLDAMR